MGAIEFKTITLNKRRKPITRKNNMSGLPVFFTAYILPRRPWLL